MAWFTKYSNHQKFKAIVKEWHGLTAIFIYFARNLAFSLKRCQHVFCVVVKKSFIDVLKSAATPSTNWSVLS